jgi:hypothetical protein
MHWNMAKTLEQLGGDEMLLQEVMDIFLEELRNIWQPCILQWRWGLRPCLLRREKSRAAHMRRLGELCVSWQ